MKRYLLILTLTLLSLQAATQDEFNSGDPQLDRWLVNINYVAQNKWRESIKKQANTFNMSEEQLLDTYELHELSPADFTVVLSIHKVTGIQWDEVVETFRKHKDTGIGKVLQVSGLSQQTEEYQQFRQLVQKEAPKKDLEAEKDNILLHNKESDEIPRKPKRSDFKD